MDQINPNIQENPLMNFEIDQDNDVSRHKLSKEEHLLSRSFDKNLPNPKELVDDKITIISSFMKGSQDQSKNVNFAPDAIKLDSEKGTK